jgi:hypothetical protein
MSSGIAGVVGSAQATSKASAEDPTIVETLTDGMRFP